MDLVYGGDDDAFEMDLNQKRDHGCQKTFEISQRDRYVQNF